MIHLTTGQHPDALLVRIDNHQTLTLKNQSRLGFRDIKVNVTYFNNDEHLIDFETVEVPILEGLTETTVTLDLDIPDDATDATLDIEAEEQTWVKRHWGKISTAAILIWGLIVLARRLTPDM